MKIIGTVVLILIAGILNFTDAQLDTDRMEEMCTERGGLQAYDDYKIGVINYDNCTLPAGTEIVQAFRSSRNGTIDSALTLYCSKVGILSNCFSTYMESTKPCLRPIPNKLMDLVINITDLVLQFPCENPKLVQDLFTTTDRSCLNSQREALTNCGEDFIMDSNQNSSTTIPNLLAAETDPLISEFDTVRCSHIQSFEQCSVNALTGCTDQIFATTLDSLFKYVNNELPCGNLPKSQKSVGSPDSIAVNVL